MKRWFGFLILILLAACLSSPSQEVNNSSINPPIERTPKDDVQPTAKPNLPEGDVSSYSFLPLTEADYRGVLNSLNADDPDRQFQISYYRLPKYRVVFRNEFLLKYPTLPDRDSIEWGVVVDDPNAVTFKSTPDMDLMEVFIQERLDAGYGVEEIIAEIEKYGGRVDSFREVKDLVGVGRNGYVFLVRIPDVYYSIASFAIFQLGEKHTVKKIRDWDISAFPSMGRYYNLLNVGDTNHNGVTEVVLQIEEGHSGIPQTWFQDIYLVEWSEQLSGFKGNLIPVFAQTCDNPCEGKWEFNTVDSIDTLLVENYWSTRGECPNLISRRLYHWVGGIYSEWETSILPPDDTLSSECQIAWAETAASIYEHDRVNNFDKGWENDLVVHLLEKSLQNWPEKADEIWGPASRDFAKLKLGIWYDYRGERDKAKKILNDLADSAYLPDLNLASRLALNYIETSEQKGVSSACAELLENYGDEFSKLFSEPVLYNFDPILLEGFGTIEWKGDLCRPLEMFPVEFTNSGITSSEDLDKWLEARGVTILQKLKIDLNNDSEPEDLVLMNRYLKNYPEIWVFSVFANDRAVIKVDEPYLYENDIKKLNLERLNIDTGHYVYLLSAGDGIAIIQSAHEGEIKTDINEYAVESYSIDTDKFPPRVTISIDERAWDGPEIKTYEWDSKTQTFVLLPNVFEIAQKELERKLYKESDLYGVIEYSDAFFETSPMESLSIEYCGASVPGGCVYAPKWYTPYFMYLKGVAYEQLGQFDDARNIYYLLWKDFPETVFGIVASMKLEKVVP